jgi:proteasome lid subunit RPN8/RPN11
VAGKADGVTRTPAQPRRALFLPSVVRRAIVAHARSERPLECCGLLIGRGRHVWSVLPAENAARSAVRYDLDPRTHIDARRVLRRIVPPVGIVGVYHSHPAGPARPSPSDIAAAAYDEWVHVIVGFRGARAEIAAFHIRRGRVTALPIVTAPSGSPMAARR